MTPKRASRSLNPTHNNAYAYCSGPRIMQPLGENKKTTDTLGEDVPSSRDDENTKKRRDNKQEHKLRNTPNTKNQNRDILLNCVKRELPGNYPKHLGGTIINTSRTAVPTHGPNWDAAPIFHPITAGPQIFDQPTTASAIHGRCTVGCSLLSEAWCIWSLHGMGLPAPFKAC